GLPARRPRRRGRPPRRGDPARRQGRPQHHGGARRANRARQGARADPSGPERRAAALLRQEERGRDLRSEGATTAPSSGVGAAPSASPAGGTPPASPQTPLFPAGSELSRRHRRREIAAAYALLAPTLLLLSLVLAYPLGWEVWISLTNFSPLNDGPTAFIGVANYRHLLSTEEFWRSATVTVVYAL